MEAANFPRLLRSRVYDPLALFHERPSKTFQSYQPWHGLLHAQSFKTAALLCPYGLYRN
jgi:hypothetical protein